MSLAVSTFQSTGGSGNDTLANFENLLGSTYNDHLTGDANANIVDGADGDDVIEGGAGSDTLIGGNGTDTLTYINAGSAITVNLATATAQNTGGAGTDRISSFENLTGSAFNDTLTGTGSNNIIEGGLGNDTIAGGSGTDTLSYASASSGITLNLASTSAQITGGLARTLYRPSKVFSARPSTIPSPERPATTPSMAGMAAIRSAMSTPHRASRSICH